MLLTPGTVPDILTGSFLQDQKSLMTWDETHSVTMTRVFGFCEFLIAGGVQKSELIILARFEPQKPCIHAA